MSKTEKEIRADVAELEKLINEKIKEISKLQIENENMMAVILKAREYIDWLVSQDNRTEIFPPIMLDDLIHLLKEVSGGV